VDPPSPCARTRDIGQDWSGFFEPLRIVDGNAAISARPGNGLAWNREAVARFSVQ
jgi:hypothetical protein